jgi:hypothetical protein
MVKMILLLLGIVNYADGFKQNFYTPKNSFSNSPNSLSFMLNQYIIFDEIGEMASQMMFMHVTIPLNLTALCDKADLFTSYLQTLQNTTNSIFKCITFNKAALDTGDYGLRRLKSIMKK